uniref:Uncharacterized protein n=1 Tax=Candidatus Methanogaster sp. ANME-2c ERB4 TaxID=2759911 RepID=A0A7G9YPH9_9EURY|nr:hypothetical protein GKKIKBAN_00027 [Methanosarcinales archaeon ANME-2c ERB4]
MYDVLGENITFVEACEALFAARLPGRIRAMTDVTNGKGANSSGAFVLTCMFSDIRSLEWKRRGLGAPSMSPPNEVSGIRGAWRSRVCGERGQMWDGGCVFAEGGVGSFSMFLKTSSGGN